MAGSNARFISGLEPDWHPHSGGFDEFPRIDDMGGEIYCFTLAVSSHAHPI